MDGNGAVDPKDSAVRFEEFVRALAPLAASLQVLLELHLRLMSPEERAEWETAVEKSAADYRRAQGIE
jgi:hypothetical protein